MNICRIGIVANTRLKYDNEIGIKDVELFKSFYKIPDVQQEKKWQTAIDEQIPLCSYPCPSNDEFLVCLNKTYTAHSLLLTFPTIPKSIKELLFIKYWLEQLFNFNYENAYFEHLLNPELILLLFKNQKNSLQLITKEAKISFLKNSVGENFSKFILNNLTIFNSFEINFNKTKNDKLLEILINGGNKFERISFDFVGNYSIHDLLIEFIQTTKDCSKIIPNIKFDYLNWPNFNLNAKAENIERGRIHAFSTFTKYKIVNIYSTKVKYFVFNEINEFGRIQKKIPYLPFEGNLKQMIIKNIV